MKYFYILFLALTLTGCAIQSTTEMMKKYFHDGEIKISKSEFDNSKQVTMLPAATYSFSPGSMKPVVYIGAYKTSKLGKNEVVLEPEYSGAHSLTKLSFSVNGKIRSFKSIDTQTNIYQGSKRTTFTGDHYNYSSKRYIVPSKYIKKILKAKKSFVRLYFRDGTYAESSIFKTKGFHDFMAKHKDAEKINKESGIKVAHEALTEFLAVIGKEFKK
jgi:hypothetical protein